MRKCQVCGKDESQGKIILFEYKTMLCWRHYLQTRRHGKPLKRTKYDKNEIVCKNGVCKMSLYKGDNVIAITTFNKPHLSEVNKYKWSMHSAGYVDNVKTGTMLHQLILGKVKGMQIDHKDHNKLNNLDSNLRICTPQQNAFNKYCKGIFWDKTRNKWIATLSINRKKVLFKRFVTKQEAIKARQQAERKYFGEFAPVRKETK